MKTIEPPHVDFDVYVARPGILWGQREENDSLTSIYGSGYLPYSGAKELCGVYYSARSARVRLGDFSLNSENRRIAKKFDGRFTKERVPAAQFAPDEGFWRFCLFYFSDKHGPNAMPEERLKTILACGVSSVVVYLDGEKPAAYVLEVEDGDMAHFWFSFYDLAYARQSLGLWLMLDCVRDAKERGLSHYYLGTVYGAKALYKTNFEPLEWWDGEKWSDDIAALKECGRSDTY